jgi:hypothetical protein
MDNIVRGLEEIELTEAELEVIYGAGLEHEGFEGLNDILCRSGGTSFTFAGTSFFTSTCHDSFSISASLTRP